MLAELLADARHLISPTWLQSYPLCLRSIMLAAMSSELRRAVFKIQE